MTETERKKVAKSFAQIREELHLNQRQMAEKLGVSASLISEIERGARDPSKKILIDFRSEFNRDVEWLLTGIDSSDSVVQEKNQKISELEAIIAKKEQEIVAINQENKTLLTQLIETQAELVKALRK